jgi:hypothetical protein
LPASKPDSELQIDADLAYQRRTWRMQRIGWFVFVLLVVAGLTGIFGSGPLSRTVAGGPTEGLSIDYERFARLHAPTTFIIRVDRRLARGDEIVVALSGDAVRGLELPATTPPVEGAGVAPGAILLRFKADRQPGELTIVLHAKPRRIGRLSSQLGVPGGPAHTIRQWIYP